MKTELNQAPVALPPRLQYQAEACAALIDANNEAGISNRAVANALGMHSAGLAYQLRLTDAWQDRPNHGISRAQRDRIREVCHRLVEKATK